MSFSGGTANKNDSDSTMLLGKLECQKIRVESVNQYDSTDVHTEDYAIDSIALEMCEFKSDGTAAPPAMALEPNERTRPNTINNPLLR